MAMIGMDITAVTQLATVMQQTADEIKGIVDNLNLRVANANWIGPDKDTFVKQWQELSTQRLGSVISQLSKTSTDLTAEAKQQADASGA